MTDDKMIILDQPHQIEAYRMLSIHSRMKLEMKGLRFRVNTFPVVRRELGLRSNTRRAQVIAAWEAKMREKGIPFGPWIA